ncbi:unnamed protein product, partial [Polarella glacialis]
AVLGETNASSRTGRYQLLTPREHVLLRPDMYIGAVDPRNETAWVLAKSSSDRMVESQLTISPGLIQIFNEILVNSIDRQYQGTSGREMSEIRITVDQKVGEISVWNDGGAIPIEVHESGLYAPTLVFGEFLSGDNFDDTQVRFTGGRNGVGAKATNAFSKSFEVTVDEPGTGQRFFQRWEDNMAKRLEPEISLLPDQDAKHGSVHVRFRPDLARFGLQRIDQDHMKLMMARAYDTAACTRPDITVSFNDEPLQVQNFEEFAAQVLGPEMTVTQVKDASGNVRAEVAAAFARDSGFGALGFVNGIRCSRGTHVTKVAEQLTDDISALVAEKLGAAKRPSQANVKQFIRLVVKVLVDSPDFDSQTKTRLTTTSSKLGFDLTVPEEFSQQVAALGVLDAAVRAMEVAQKQALHRTLSTGARPSLAKLEDATNAGKSGHNCTLIVTEGDSAKALAVAGLAKLGRANYGVFPLKGKLLNVRTASVKQLQLNEEIKNLVHITGLEWGQEYRSEADLQSLRYQRLMIFSDQDLDGHHIAGLVINFIQANWPSLLKMIPDFLQRFATPIVKIFPSRGSSKVAVQEFFTQGDFAKWERQQPTDWNSKFRAKYYKGLGTSTRDEAIEYFSNPERHVLDLVLESEEDADAVERAFEQNRVADRKAWMLKYDVNEELDYTRASATYSEFFDKQFVHFSVYDCQRSIPLLLDGLKPSQRKVLHVLQTMDGEKKVSQVTGLVSAATSYHHGEESLVKVIVHMAQTFVGTNNLNLLQPNGMFGTRLSGRDSHASARYIHTETSPLVKEIFKKDDVDILEKQFEDGQEIEPKSFAPVFPLVLVNGFKGIGTGWATDGPNYDPVEVVNALKKAIKGETAPELLPSYRGFSGRVYALNGKVVSEGLWRVYGSKGAGKGLDTVEVTELPIGVWTDDFISNLEEKAKKTRLMMAIHKCEDHNDEKVHLLIGFENSELLRLTKSRNVTETIGLYLGLRKNLQSSNMWLYHPPEVGDELGEPVLQKFEGPADVIRAFHSARRPYYERRKAKMTQKLVYQATVLRNKARCIKMCIDGSLPLTSLDSESLKAAGFDSLLSESQSSAAESSGETPTSKAGFDYLLNMPLRSFSQVKVQELGLKLEKTEEDLKRLESKGIDEVWLEDLDAFLAAYKKAFPKLPAASELVLAAKEEKQAQAVFNQERKRRTKGAFDEDDGVQSFKLLEKQTVPQLRDLCSLRGLNNSWLGRSKGDLVNILLAYSSKAFSYRDWAKMQVDDLKAHLRARGRVCYSPVLGCLKHHLFVEFLLLFVLFFTTQNNNNNNNNSNNKQQQQQQQRKIVHPERFAPGWHPIGYGLAPG